ncbi:hypothetical protein V5O48_001959 [Marasmius crinis-equi]|uniref:Uncharacterized protein n=1 Tax=Marasmius crinis-equi TaxID=585013 RepID=A0ABR3FWV8_9AGAR
MSSVLKEAVDVDDPLHGIFEIEQGENIMPVLSIETSLQNLDLFEAFLSSPSTSDSSYSSDASDDSSLTTPEGSENDFNEDEPKDAKSPTTFWTPPSTPAGNAFCADETPIVEYRGLLDLSPFGVTDGLLRGMSFLDMSDEGEDEEKNSSQEMIAELAYELLNDQATESRSDSPVPSIEVVGPEGEIVSRE